MSRTGLTTLQPLLSKAKVCGVKRFLVASVTIPVTHRQSPPMAGCLQCPWGQSCHSNAPGEASYLWLGRAGRGRKAQQGQEGDWKIDTETGHVPGLGSPWDGAGPLLWGDRLRGGGKDWAASSPFSSRAAEPPPGHSQEKGLRTASWALGLITAPQDGYRESWALAMVSAPGVGAADSGALGLTEAPQDGDGGGSGL